MLERALLVLFAFVFGALGAPSAAFARPKVPRPPKQEEPASNGPSAPPASPPPPAGKGDGDASYAKHMELGIRLFEDRNYDAALTEFERAYQERPKASPLINMALCYKGRFEYKKAIVTLQRALAKHRDSIDDPQKIEKAIAEMAELLGTVRLEVSPKSADYRVRLDGELLDVGVGPATFDVSPGGHTIVIEAPGFEAATRPFRIASGDTMDLTFELAAAEGLVQFESARRDISVLVDAEPLPAGRMSKRLKPGAHMAEIVWPGRRHVASFVVASGKTVKIVLRKNGELSVAGGPPKQPDAMAPPPVKGIYMVGLFDAGLRTSSAIGSVFATSARLGYRFTRRLGVEGELRGLTTVTENPQGEGDLRLYALQARVYGRVMSATEVVRAVAAFGVGYTYEAAYAPSLADPPTGHGFCANIEPGLEVDLSHVILGFQTPFAFSVTGVGAALEISGGLRIGYGDW